MEHHQRRPRRSLQLLLVARKKELSPAEHRQHGLAMKDNSAVTVEGLPPY
jgi:hypothetical protein